MSDETYNFFCLIEGDTNVFSVTASPTIPITDLKDLIQEKGKNGVLNGVDAKDLTLWKVCVAPPPTDKWKDFTGNNVQGLVKLEEFDNISDYWPMPPTPKHLHILVERPSERLLGKRKRDGEGGLPPPVKALIAELSKESPSTLANHKLFKSIAGSYHAVGCNRPFETDTIPLELLDQAFAIFKTRCRAEPSKSTLAGLMELAHVGCTWHDSETHRRDETMKVLRKVTGLFFHAEKIFKTEFMTDGNLPVTIIPPAIRKCKNEHGEAVNEAIAYYGRFLISAIKNRLCYYNYDTRFPSILIVDIGPFLGFYGALWDGSRIRVEPLTPVFDLTIHWREEESRHAIASTLDALVVAVEDIEVRYITLNAKATANPTPLTEWDLHLQKNRGFPFLTSYKFNQQKLTFHYNERLDNEKLVFSATLDQPGSDDSECVVKFTQRYSEDVHKHLANLGLAPRLRRCVQVSAGWIAVIMDRSKYEKLYGLCLNDVEETKVRWKVMSALKCLHELGFVHGDIQSPNILIDRGTLASEDVAIHLVDFDWAGRIGEAKYPIDVNKETIRRPDDVEGGGLITENHDTEMVSYLFSL